MKFHITKNIMEVYDSYLNSYNELNWNQSLKNYMNESIYNFYTYNGELYKLNYKDYTIGHLTVYKLHSLIYGIGMLHINIKECNFSLGDVSLIYNFIKNTFKDKSIYGFCNNEKLVELYSQLGFENVQLHDSIYLIYNNKDVLDVMDLTIRF